MVDCLSVMADWDLSAVVRSCNSTTTTPQHGVDQDPLAFLASLPSELENELVQFSFPDLVDTTRDYDFDELQYLCLPFLLPKPRTSSLFNEIQDQQSLPMHQTLLQPPTNNINKPTNSGFVFGESSNSQQLIHPEKPEKSPAKAQPLPFRPRKRKYEKEREVHLVTAANMSLDSWAWRKYGQKPIKGSSYPRNYYRCSSLKECSARKQVDRSNTDPNMFILTYTGGHIHPMPSRRSSLAGSTRNKVQKTETKNDTALASSAAAALTERESDEVEEDEFEDFDDVLIPNLDINGDLFEELRGLSAARAVDGNYTWSPGTSVATAGAGGG